MAPYSTIMTYKKKNHVQSRGVENPNCTLYGSKTTIDQPYKRNSNQVYEIQTSYYSKEKKCFLSVPLHERRIARAKPYHPHHHR